MNCNEKRPLRVKERFEKFAEDLRLFPEFCANLPLA